MKVNLANMSIEELVELVNDASELIEQKKKDRRKELRAQFEKLASESGLSLSDIVDKRSAAKPRGPVAQKYRNPKNHEETWSGRGRRPKWVEALLATGKTLDSCTF